jgi:hypothetical protein
VKSSTIARTPEPLAPGQHVGGEVERPALIRCLAKWAGCAHAGGPLAAASPPHGQPFLAIEPVQLLMVHRDPFPRQQDAEPAVAEASALAGQIAQPLADLRRLCHRRTPHRLRVHVDQPAGMALGDAVRRHQMQRRRTPRRRRAQFFASRSLSAVTSSIDSASSFFRRRFSSSRPFRRCASDGPQPAVLRLPAIEGLLADPVPAAHLRRRRGALLLTQHADDLPLVEPALAHRPSPDNGLSSRPKDPQGSRSAAIALHRSSSTRLTSQVDRMACAGILVVVHPDLPPVAGNGLHPAPASL